MTTTWDEGAIAATAVAIAREIRRLDSTGAHHRGGPPSFDDFHTDAWSRPAWADLDNDHHDIWLLRDPAEALPGILAAARTVTTALLEPRLGSWLGHGVLVGPATGRWDGPGTLVVGLDVADATFDAIDAPAAGLPDESRGGPPTTSLGGGTTWLSSPAASELPAAVETAIRTRLATYFRCPSCRRVKPPEWGEGLCYSCMEERGVVF